MGGKKGCKIDTGMGEIYYHKTLLSCICVCGPHTKSVTGSRNGFKEISENITRGVHEGTLFAKGTLMLGS